MDWIWDDEDLDFDNLIWSEAISELDDWDTINPPIDILEGEDEDGEL